MTPMTSRPVQAEGLITSATETGEGDQEITIRALRPLAFPLSTEPVKVIDAHTYDHMQAIIHDIAAREDPSDNEGYACGYCLRAGAGEAREDHDPSCTWRRAVELMHSH